MYYDIILLYYYFICICVCTVTRHRHIDERTPWASQPSQTITEVNQQRSANKTVIKRRHLQDLEILYLTGIHIP